MTIENENELERLALRQRKQATAAIVKLETMLMDRIIDALLDRVAELERVARCREALAERKLEGKG